MQQGSPGLRAAALTSLGALPPGVYGALPATSQAAAFSTPAAAVQAAQEPVPAVRAAAARALGALCGLQELLEAAGAAPVRPSALAWSS